jgi:hypothetical protein
MRPPPECHGRYEIRAPSSNPPIHETRLRRQLPMTSWRQRPAQWCARETRFGAMTGQRRPPAPHRQPATAARSSRGTVVTAPTQSRPAPTSSATRTRRPKTGLRRLQATPPHRPARRMATNAPRIPHDLAQAEAISLPAAGLVFTRRECGVWVLRRAPQPDSAAVVNGTHKGARRLGQATAHVRWLSRVWKRPVERAAWPWAKPPGGPARSLRPLRSTDHPQRPVRTAG